MKYRSEFFLLPAALLVLLTSGCTDGTDTNTPEIDFSPSATRTLVTTLGSDSLSVEIYTRTENEINGILVARSPSTYMISYTAILADDGTIQQFSAERSTPKSDGSREFQMSWTVSLEDGQATLVREGGQNPGSITMEAPHGTIPTLGRATAAGFVLEQVGLQLGDMESEEAETWLIYPTSTAPQQNRSMVLSADSISMDFFGSPRYGWFGDGKQLLGASALKTTMKSETRRSLPLDVDELADRWAAMDAAGQGIGTPSPKAEFSRSVAGTDIEIIYSQPAKRGRDIWGTLVPYNEVWRTGANSATMFSTSKNIVIEGTSIPAGTYTLWTTFTADSQTLIINSQTGQWGTQYDSSQDFARVPMTMSSAPAFSERFTFSADETDGGGQLNLDWDNTRFSVQFSVE